VFNEVKSCDLHSEITDNVDLSVDIDSHHINNVAHSNGCYNADVERCIEIVGNDAGSSCFIASFASLFQMKLCRLLNIQNSEIHYYE